MSIDKFLTGVFWGLLTGAVSNGILYLLKESENPEADSGTLADDQEDS